MTLYISKRAPKFGVGINDTEFGANDPKTGKRCKFYNHWNHMLARCFSEVYKTKEPSYAGATCVDEWKYLSNFRGRMETQDWEGCVLDKDILIKGNKVYSPETCVFVPTWLNSLLLSRDNDRGPYPLGVHFNKVNGLHYSRISKFGKRVHIGVYDNPATAHKDWQLAKIQHINESINRYVAEKDLQGRFADSRIIKALKERANMIQYDFDNELVTEKV